MLVLLLLNLKDVFKRFVNEITSRNFEDINDNTFTIYGEWCGGNIQKVWVFQIYQNLSLSLVLKFHKFKDGEEARPYWIPYHYLCSSEDNIYNIDDYTNYTIDIDFNMPQLVQNTLSELTMAVERRMPCSESFWFVLVLFV
jgi:hypothetical protein